MKRKLSSFIRLSLLHKVSAGEWNSSIVIKTRPPWDTPLPTLRRKRLQPARGFPSCPGKQTQLVSTHTAFLPQCVFAQETENPSHLLFYYNAHLCMLSWCRIPPCKRYGMILRMKRNGAYGEIGIWPSNAINVSMTMISLAFCKPSKYEFKKTRSIKSLQSDARSVSMPCNVKLTTRYTIADSLTVQSCLKIVLVSPTATVVVLLTTLSGRIESESGVGIPTGSSYQR